MEGPARTPELGDVGPRRRGKMLGNQRFRPNNGCEENFVETDA